MHFIVFILPTMRIITAASKTENRISVRRGPLGTMAGLSQQVLYIYVFGWEDLVLELAWRGT